MTNVERVTQHLPNTLTAARELGKIVEEHLLEGKHDEAEIGELINAFRTTLPKEDLEDFNSVIGFPWPIVVQ